MENKNVELVSIGTTKKLLFDNGFNLTKKEIRTWPVEERCKIATWAYLNLIISTKLFKVPSFPERLRRYKSV